jgi:hypothetical protein
VRVLACGIDGAAPVVERAQRRTVICPERRAAAPVMQEISFAVQGEVPEPMVIWVDDEAYPCYVVE